MLQVSSTTRSTGEDMKIFLDIGFSKLQLDFIAVNLGGCFVHYSVRLVPRDLPQHDVLPRGWRLGGIAYEFGDQVYDQPNRTMVSYAEGMMVKGKHRGTKKEIRWE